MDQLDLHPAAAELVRQIRGTAQSDLDQPTPCEDWTVADLLQHIQGFASASAAAARRAPFAADAPELTAELASTWKQDLPTLVGQLATAWEPSAAWSGMTDAGGIELPAEIAGNAALQELLLHGWDLARATGQEFNPDEASVQMCLAFVSALSEEDRSRPFAAPVDVPSDATILDQLLALSGRDPQIS